MKVSEALLLLRNDLMIWVANNLKTKVSKEEGKQLSSNDFTNEYKRKMDNLSLDWNSISNKPLIYPPAEHTHDTRYIPLCTESTAGKFDKTTTVPANNERLNYNGYFHATKIYGSVYNDYAEARPGSEEFEPGSVVVSKNGVMVRSSSRLNPLARVISDTHGMCIGEGKAVVAVCGRVLVKTDFEVKEEHLGRAVCSGIDGRASLMSDEELRSYPHAVLGFIESIPDYEKWGTDSIEVKNRIWIEVK